MPAGAAITMMDFFGKHGFILTFSALLIIYMTLPPFVYMVLDVKMYYNAFMRKRVRDFVSSKNLSIHTLESAKKYWRKADFIMSFCYSRVVRNLAMNMFLLPIMPLSSIFFLVITSIFYWVNKYILIQRSSKLIPYSTKLCNQMIDEVELCLMLFVLGCIFRDGIYQFIHLEEIRVRVLHIVVLVLIVLAYMYNLKKKINRFLPAAKVPSVSYEDMIQSDPNSYYLLNLAYNKDELTQGRRHKRMRQSHLANQIFLFVKPTKDMYELQELEAAKHD